MAICDFCDAPADVSADRCSSCHASFRQECPKCGTLKSVFETRCEKCPSLPARLQTVGRLTEPPRPAPTSTTTGSAILRIFGLLQVVLGLLALESRLWPISLLCLAVLIFCFVVARMKDVTESMAQRLERIEQELLRRDRHPDRDR